MALLDDRAIVSAQTFSAHALTEINVRRLRLRKIYDRQSGDRQQYVPMNCALMRCAVAALITLTAGCGDPSPPENLETRIARAEALTPEDPRLAEIYARSCRACHVNPESGAPLTGDANAWNARFSQGAATVAAHARDGVRAMPPRGQCFDCSDADLWRLTLFMARREMGNDHGVP